MSASTAQPMTGHANQSAPLGILATFVGAIVLCVVGLALAQGVKPAAAGVVAGDYQAALHAQQMGEKAPLFSGEESLLIKIRGEWNDKAKAFPPAISGPATGAQKGLGGSPTQIGGWGGPSLVVPRADGPTRGGHHGR
jgi:hypothetical protein